MEVEQQVDVRSGVSLKHTSPVDWGQQGTLNPASDSLCHIGGGNEWHGLVSVIIMICACSKRAPARLKRADCVASGIAACIACFLKNRPPTSNVTLDNALPGVLCNTPACAVPVLCLCTVCALTALKVHAYILYIQDGDAFHYC